MLNDFQVPTTLTDDSSTGLGITDNFPTESLISKNMKKIFHNTSVKYLLILTWHGMNAVI